MKKLKCFVVSSSAIALLGIASITIADNPPPIVACEKYLSYSDSQFESWLKSNNKDAKIVSAELGECLQTNSCNSISRVDNCSATLASRTFLSTFYANYTTDNSSLAPPSSGPGNHVANAAPPPSSSGGTNNHTANAVGGSDKSSAAPKSTSSSVHWF